MKRVYNPPSPYIPYNVEWVEEPPEVALTVYEEKVGSIVTKNESPDVPFRFGINPYRGCFHGCIYCYARPTHQYIDFGAGTDFERKLVVKMNAAERLREHFLKRSWKGETVVFSGVTDCYQPLEACYGITRQCLEVCLEFRNPVAIITKAALIQRDRDLLCELREKANARVFISIPFIDKQMARKVEPYAPSPEARLRTVAALAEVGIPVGVSLAPTIPGLNDSQIPQVLERAYEAGARRAFMTLLRLPAEVKEVFLSGIEEKFPTRSQKILHQIGELRGGKLNQSEFGNRMRGSGSRWEALEWLFDSTCKRLGMNVGEADQEEQTKTFRRPSRQMSLLEL